MSAKETSSSMSCTTEAERKDSQTGSNPPPQDAITTPVVFQCASCRRVVGDTLALRHQDYERGTVTLAAAHDILVHKNYQTSHDTEDLGSTYLLVSCQCSKVVGKMYKTTPRHLDYLRDMFTLEAKHLTTYAVGMAKQGPGLSDWFNKSWENLFTGQAKLMTIILAMEERLSAVESSVVSSTSSASSSLAPPPSLHPHPHPHPPPPSGLVGHVVGHMMMPSHLRVDSPAPVAGPPPHPHLVHGSARLHHPAFGPG